MIPQEIAFGVGSLLALIILAVVLIYSKIMHMLEIRRYRRELRKFMAHSVSTREDYEFYSVADKSERAKRRMYISTTLNYRGLYLCHQNECDNIWDELLNDLAKWDS